MGLKWLNISHTISLCNAREHSGNCGAEATLGESYPRQAKVSGGYLELEFDHLGTVSVADVLADPERFIDETLADPLEGTSFES